MDPAFKWLYMDLRISHYIEDDILSETVGAIVCFYKGSLLKVRPGKMSELERYKEWIFGTDLSRDNVICTVQYGRGMPTFHSFRPDLNQPGKETLK